MNSVSPSRTTFQQALIVIGPTIAIVVSWLLSVPDRTDSNGFTLANVALVVAVVTVGAATVDWAAGVTTSIAAALALNYFHTEPYRTLRITDRRDVYSIVLLGVLGLAVSAATAARVRHSVTQMRHVDARRSNAEFVDSLDDYRPAPEMWSAAISAAANDLGMVMARMTTHNPSDLASIRRRLNDDDTTLVLPQSGGAMALLPGDQGQRWLVLTPKTGLAPLTVDRRAVVALADAIEMALEPAQSEA